jgi:hypothetical protein
MEIPKFPLKTPAGIPNPLDCLRTFEWFPPQCDHSVGISEGHKIRPSRLLRSGSRCPHNVGDRSGSFRIVWLAVILGHAEYIKILDTVESLRGAVTRRDTNKITKVSIASSNQ